MGSCASCLFCPSSNHQSLVSANLLNNGVSSFLWLVVHSLSFAENLRLRLLCTTCHVFVVLPDQIYGPVPWDVTSVPASLTALLAQQPNWNFTAQPLNPLTSLAFTANAGMTRTDPSLTSVINETGYWTYTQVGLRDNHPHCLEFYRSL